MLLKIGGAIKTINNVDCSFNNSSGIRTLGIESREKGLLVTKNKNKKVLSRVGGGY